MAEPKQNLTDEERAKKRANWRAEANAYRATAKGRASIRAANSSYAKTESGRQGINARHRKLQNTAEHRAYARAYSAKRKADGTWVDARRESQRKYRVSEKGKDSIKRHGTANAEFIRFQKQLVHTKRGRPRLTLDQYHARYEAQDFMCAICGSVEFPLHIDHCHSGGHFRGLLCNRCNTGLGKFLDDPNMLRGAASYIESRA